MAGKTKVQEAIDRLMAGNGSKEDVKLVNAFLDSEYPADGLCGCGCGDHNCNKRKKGK